jgi:hypothetical protein
MLSSPAGPSDDDHCFEAPMWRYPGRGGWRFITLTHDVADHIEATALSGGFGSVRVRVTVGATSWETSVFPSKAEASYLLPVKAAVRAAEGLGDGDVVEVHLTVLHGPKSPTRDDRPRSRSRQKR